MSACGWISDGGGKGCMIGCVTVLQLAVQLFRSDSGGGGCR